MVPIKEKKNLKEFVIINLPLIIVFCLQIIVWNETKRVMPDMSIVPEVPGKETIKAMSFGDEQFYFRILGLRIQNCGDTFGRFSALKDYNYENLAKWFFLLDYLDSESNFIPSIASYYYSNTQRKSDTKYIIDYLVAHADKNPETKWWWYYQAFFIARFRLEDKHLALEIANKLASSPANLPLWAKQLPAFMHADLGEKEEALRVIENLLNNVENIPEAERNFMYYFVKDRLKLYRPDLFENKKEK